MNTRRTIGAAATWVVLAAALVAGCADKPEGLVASAKEALAKHDRSTAIIQLKNALQENPDLAEARFLLGKTLLDTGDPAAAEKELRKARELKVPDAQVVPLIARALLLQNEPRKAIDEFGKVELQDPGARAELAAMLGQAYMVTGNAGTARRLFEDAQKAVPGHPSAMLGEARLDAGTGKLTEAMAVVEGVLAKSPDLVEGWQLKGDIAGIMAQPENAIVAYRKALELRPDFLAAHTRITGILIQQGKTQEANAQVDAMKKIAPKHPQTLYLQALLAFREKNYIAAREAIQLHLRAVPDSLPGLVLDANIAFHLGAYAQAETSLLKALQQAPKERLARMILVNTYLRSRQPTKALDAVKPLLQGDGENNADVLALAGEVYMQNGNTTEAERVFAKAAALDPKDSNKRTSLALTHISTGESERGFKELEEAAAADAGIRADLALIAAHTRQRKWDAALKAIDDLEKKQPDKPLPHNLRGAVYAGKGETAAARKSFERALQLEPADFAAAASLARLDLADKKPDDARKRFESVIAKDPKNTRALLALAELRAQGGGTTDEVAALISKAVAADPTNVTSRLVLVNFYLRAKEPKKAVAAAQDALAAIPDRAELLEAAGQAQLAAGDTNQAVATFTKLAKVRPGAPEPYIHMANAQMAAKDPDGAVQSLKKALTIRPDNVGIERAIVKVTLDAGRDAEALAMARNLQKSRPKESVGYMLEGDINMSKKNWSEAASAYRIGLKSVGTTDLAVRLNAALRAGGNVAEADKLLADWVRDHPKDRDVRAYLAELAIEKRDYRAAVAHYKSMLEIRSDDALALNNLAYFSGELKDPKALEYAERARNLAPNNAAILDTYGVLLADRGEVKRGIEMLQKAVSLAPASTGIRLNLARALIKDGQKAAAKKELEALAQLGDRFSGQAEVASLMKTL